MAATFARVHRGGREATLKHLFQSINSGLPNEIDWAFRACVALSFDGLYLARVPGLLEYMLAHTQGFADSPEFITLTAAGPALPHPEKWMLEFFHADYDLPKECGKEPFETLGLRLVQCAVVLRNLSLDLPNVQLLGASPLVLRFLARCLGAENAHGSIVRGQYSKFNVIFAHRVDLAALAWETLANIASAVQLHQFDDRGEFVASRVLSGLESTDRTVLLAATLTLGRLAYSSSNHDWIASLEGSVLERLYQLVFTDDAQILLDALEALYQLTVLPSLAARAASMRGFVGTLVSLLAFDIDRLSDRHEPLPLHAPHIDQGCAPAVPHKSGLAVSVSLASMDAAQANAETWVRKNFEPTEDRSLLFRRADIYQAYADYHRDSPSGLLSPEVFTFLFRLIFPQVSVCTLKSVGRALFFSGVRPVIETRPVFPPKQPQLPHQQQLLQAQRVRFSETPTSKAPTISLFSTAGPATPGTALASAAQSATPIAPAPVMAPLSPAASPAGHTAEGSHEAKHKGPSAFSKPAAQISQVDGTNDSDDDDEEEIKETPGTRRSQRASTKLFSVAEMLRDDDGRNTPDRSHGKRKSAGRRRAADDDDDEFADAEAEFKIRIKLSKPDETKRPAGVNSPAHTSAKPAAPSVFICEWDGCGQSFSVAYDLVMHLDSAHIPLEAPEYVCRWQGCVRQLVTPKRKTLQNHMYTHIGRYQANEARMEAAQAREAQTVVTPRATPHARTVQAKPPSSVSHQLPQLQQQQQRQDGLSAAQAAAAMNAYITNAAAHRQQQAAIAGCEWVLEPACDSHVSGSVRYSAAVILRNLIRTPEARSAVRPYEMQLVEYLFSSSPASSVLASCLSSLSEIPH